jgi:5-methylcytosine-specific restriction endonuclease McrA
MSKPRRPIPVMDSVEVFFRDKWICHWCGRPVVFSPAFRLLQCFVKKNGYTRPIAYFHPNWSRASAPLLDHLGAVIDHVEAHSKGGEHDQSNFVTSCNKCNTSKNARLAAVFASENPKKLVKGKYGEPLDWDGLVSLFLLLAEQGMELEAGERRWEKAFRAYFAQCDEGKKSAGEK